MEAWRYALASVTGSSHIKAGTDCQDASACRILNSTDGHETLVAVVSDGAGSALRGGVGAELACALFQDEIGTLIECGGSPNSLSREFFTQWLVRFTGEVQARAAAEGLMPRDFACTLLGAVIGPETAAFCQIGDGAIVCAHNDGYDWVFWPQEGEYANQTRFATETDAADHLEFQIMEAQVDEVALFSDGLQRLALHYASQTAHDPFFRPTFQVVRRAAAGHAHDVSDALNSYLASERVTHKTDDDTTLVLATRCVLPPTEIDDDIGV
jgi:hypothetical protein